jgi:cytochrome c553
MFYAKFTAIFITLLIGFASCGGQQRTGYMISESKEYDASLFRQHCAICHGPEGNGKMLDNGTKVPSLRTGPFKFTTQPQITNQIANGGNGMPPFRYLMSQREIDIMGTFVHDKLRLQ